jgi:thiol-disulfide isomerase/thioredoxin
MNFWATWCEPCVEEIPIFAKFRKNRKNVTVIGISMDEPEKQEQVIRFIKQYKMNYRVAIWTGDNFENMVNSIDPKWNGPIPATFIFQKGKLIYSKTGPITESELKNHIPN